MRCVSHADKKAARQCTRCQRCYCGLCVKQLTVGDRVLEVCAMCKAPLSEVRQVFRPSPPVSELLWRALSKEGVIMAIALSWLMALAGWMPGIGKFINFACFAAITAYYFQIIKHVGEGKPGLPGPADTIDTVGEMRAQLFRGWICMFAAALPLLLWIGLVHRGDNHGPAEIFILMLIGMTYLPASIVCVVLTESWVGAIYPIAWFEVIRRAPRSYVKLWGLFMASLIAWQLIAIVCIPIAGVPIIGGLVITVAQTLATFAQAALVGGFLMRHAGDFGYD